MASKTLPIEEEIQFQTDHDFTTEDSIKKKDFAPEFLDTITSWILDQVEVVEANQDTYEMKRRCFAHLNH